MTMEHGEESVPPKDLIAETEELCREVADELVVAMRTVRRGAFGDVKSVMLALRDLRVAFQMVIDERDRVEKYRKEESGIVHHYALDFDAARDEIGRRLARLRAAGAG